jgi:RimJ/RimL family protein N-acetyltransferase
MGLAFQPADEVTVRAFWAWQYEAPYDVYNLDPEEIEEGLRYFLDPEINCYGVTDEEGELVAYCTFGRDAQVPGGHYAADAQGERTLDIGLGVRPELTGHGMGHWYISELLDFARRTFAPTVLRVTLAAFNERAIRVWQRAGFGAVERFERVPDGMAFVVLTRAE